MTVPHPRITIGLPVYSGERFLPGTLDSILAQSFGDLEVVISDNASIDRTAEICLDYAHRDRRIRYVRSTENRGAAWNHNHVVEIAQGEYFKWAGSDDIYEPAFVAECLRALQGDCSAVLAYPRTVAIDETGVELYRYSPGWELRSASAVERVRSVILKGGHWLNADAASGVIRIDALRKTRLLPAYLGGDKRLLGELSLLGTFLEVPDYLLRRRFHPDSSGKRNPVNSGYRRESVDWMARFFKGSTSKSYLPSWALFVDHLSTIWASSLPPWRKVQLSAALPRAFYWYKQFFLGELANLRYVWLPRRTP